MNNYFKEVSKVVNKHLPDESTIALKDELYAVLEAAILEHYQQGIEQFKRLHKQDKVIPRLLD